MFACTGHKVTETREQHYRLLGRCLFDGQRQRVPIHLRHGPVSQDEIKRAVIFELFKSLPSVASDRNVVLVLSQVDTQDLPHQRLVLDHENL